MLLYQLESLQSIFSNFNLKIVLQSAFNHLQKKNVIISNQDPRFVLRWTINIKFVFLILSEVTKLISFL